MPHQNKPGTVECANCAGSGIMHHPARIKEEMACDVCGGSGSLTPVAAKPAPKAKKRSSK